jgi:hypothetical protein
LAVLDDICAMACFEGGFHLIDVSDSENPVLMGTFDKDDEYPWGVALYNEIAYVSYRNKFVRIFDISDPENPIEQGMVYDDLKWPWNMLISKDLMHVADYKGGVITYDISDPVHPVQIERLNHSLALDLDLQGEFLYEGQYGSLKILDCRHSSQAPEGIVTVKYNFRNLTWHGTIIISYYINLKTLKPSVYFNSSGP